MNRVLGYASKLGTLLVHLLTVFEVHALAPEPKCSRLPQFLKSVGFSQRSVLTTTLERRKGLFLQSIDEANVPTSKVYQHPSWTQAGSLGAITLDSEGNVYTFAVAHVDLTSNPLDKNGTIYRVDAKSGVMAPWFELPLRGESNENPYGIVGITFSCSTNSIYVSSVKGSSRTRVSGSLFQVDVATKRAVDELPKFDGFGLALVRVGADQFLLSGSTRTSELFAVRLSPKGHFASQPVSVYSIANLGPRGDDKIKKIELASGTATVSIVGTEFNFNLASTFPNQEDRYEVSVSHFETILRASRGS